MPKRQGKTTLQASAIRELYDLYSVRPDLVPLKPIGKLDSQVGAFADLPRGLIVLIGQTHFLERLEEPVQILCQEPPAKDRIDPCPNKSSVTGSFIAHWPVKYSWKSYSQVFVARLPAGRKLDRTAGEGVFRPDL